MQSTFKLKMIFFISIAILIALPSCSKKDNGGGIVTPEPIDPNPVQYGIPFAGVPDRSDAIIYQVNIRPFSTVGNFAGVQARLDSIKTMGVNVIYLMPVFPVGTVNAVNSPYCVKEYKAVNAEFGTLTDLRAIVDGAHSRNMSVILDWVANHSSWDNSWISTHSDWYRKNAAGNIISPPGTGWNDVAQLDFNNSAMRLEMIRCMKYWVYTANVDGFRCDYADGPPADFWKQAIDSLRSITTHKLLLLAEGSNSSNFSAGFDFNFGFGYYGQLKNIFGNNSSVAALSATNSNEYSNAGSDQQVVRYTTNHDVNSSDGTPLDLFGGRNGAIAAFTLCALQKGVPMLYCGQEVGTPFKIVFPFTGTKINWSLGPDIKAEYKKLLNIRNNSLAIRKGVLTEYADNNVAVFTKSVTGEKILVIVNCRNSNSIYTLPVALANSNWQDQVSGGNYNLGTTLNLAPYQYFILKQ